jgi:hypothetical protein
MMDRCRFPFNLDTVDGCKRLLRAALLQGVSLGVFTGKCGAMAASTVA